MAPVSHLAKTATMRQSVQPITSSTKKRESNMTQVLLPLILAVSMVSQMFPTGMPKQVMNTTHRIEMRVTTSDEDGKTIVIGDVCSATSIGKHSLLTATHCDMGAASLRVDGVDTDITARINDGNDHTIYTVKMTLNKVAGFSQTTLNVGDEVWLRGNPDGFNQLVRYGHYSGNIVEEGKTYEMFDIDGGHGDSGSAIFNKSGKIVAVTSIGFSDGSFGMLGTFELKFTPAQLANVK